MATDDELPEDEEEILVYVEFDGLISDNAFGNEQLRLDMIGVDTDHPIVQINGRFYEGTYEDAVGTYMFFEKSEEDLDVDLVFDTPANLKYVNKTRKILKMQRVFIENRGEVLGDSENSQCMPNLEIIQEAGVPLKYHGEALSFWNKLRDYRMDVLNSYLEKQKLREERKSKGIAIDSESDDDHPFAAYRPEEEDETGIETANVDSESKAIENNVLNKTEESEEISKMSDNEHETIDSGNKESKTKDIVLPNVEEPSTSAATECNTSNKKKVTKKKLQTVTVKKPKVANTVTKRKLKKSQASKTVKTVAQDESTHDINESHIEEVDEKCKEVKEKEEESNEPSTLKQEQQMEVNTPTTVTNKKEKELKREAKMQEILERLEALAADNETEK